jgi:hypothetical protein
MLAKLKINLRKQVQENIVYPKVYVERWVDYSSKYGLGYLLSNTTVGVYFNDNSKIISHINDELNISYHSIQVEGAEIEIQKINLEKFPEKLTKKITLFKHFKKFFKSRKTRAARYKES